ncbi:MAG: malto-oligosyltrehalose trehalohydrolase [Candidatus Eisenbacteria bacterium]|nr:malto-oligosyltrehalose trehalohydrolase [Candidatus Latescibacterota bacterium]MBD3301323.1 malto-oligosyltrehalose trehalohydrolase [Candidatus Eisenbacteria bacterium]
MERQLGAIPRRSGGTDFRVWAPFASRLEVVPVQPEGEPVPLAKDAYGYFSGSIAGIGPGDRYLYRIDADRERPDPASRAQPDGVHGPSMVIEPKPLEDRTPGWKGLPLHAYVLYEIHVGTFSPEGTFDGVARRLDRLRDLGITAIELMPVASFPGARNWGYDGVYPYAAQASYGGAEGLRRLADACHDRGMAVVLDVVYNHLGPEGNYLGDFGPYFTDTYRTPWGQAINFDGPDSDPVRAYFIENAMYWIRTIGIDGLRIDAIHGIRDASARPFLAELAQTVQEYAKRADRHVPVVSESDLNDVRVLRPRRQGGFGHDGQWNDDLHHALHALLTGEREGYYRDFGRVGDLAKAIRHGFVYDGRYSRFRRRRHGTSSRSIDPRRWVVFAQNHDQVGNRALGDRLVTLVSPALARVASGLVALSPSVPLLFMGEEYGETAPFQYFVSHGDPDLVEAVRAGRSREFASFGWRGTLPDPQAEETFRGSRLSWDLQHEGAHARTWAYHRALLRLRARTPALTNPWTREDRVGSTESPRVLWMRRRTERGRALVIANFEAEDVALSLSGVERPARKRIDSADRRWGGSGSRAPTRLDSSMERLVVTGESIVLYD